MTSSTGQFGSKRGPPTAGLEQAGIDFASGNVVSYWAMRSIAPAPADYDRASQVTEKR